MAAPTKLISTSQGFQDAKGTVVALGSLSLTLSQNAEITATGGQVTTEPLYFQLDANGKITSSAVWFNDELTPSGTTYHAILYAANGMRIIQDFGSWSIAGASADLSLMVPTSVGASFPAPVLISPSGNQNISQPSGTSLNVNRFEGIRFADQFTGADIGAKINAAITDLGANGGTIIIPAGSYSFSTQINLSGLRSIILQGQGGLSAGAATATTLTWTGTGTTSAINLQNTLGCSLRDFFLVYNSASFTGVLVDASGPVSNTAYFKMLDCSIGGAGVTSAAVLISLDKAQSSTIQSCRMAGCAVAIRGAATNGSFSNAIQVINCTFSDSTGTISSAMIQNFTQGLKVSGCTFELGSAAGNCKILDYTGTLSGSGVEFDGCWAGDDNATGARTLFNWTVGCGQFSGNFIGASGTNTTVFNFPASSFADISGNAFSTALVLFALAGNVRLNVGVNVYSGLATFMTGSPIDGAVFDNTDQTTYYGSQLVKGNWVLRNGADATQGIFIEPGSTADQIGQLVFTDKTPTAKFSFQKKTDNTFQILDAASVVRMTIGNAINSSVGISGSGNGGVILNGLTGTGGVVFEDGSTGAQMMAVSSAGIISRYTNLATSGNGVSVVLGATSQKSETAADTNVLTFTPPATVGSYRIRFVMSISAANAATLGWTATWTDSNGNAQTPTNLALTQSGTAAPALTFTTSAAGNYCGYVDIDVNSAGTAIVVKLTFTGTSFTGKVSATVERVI